MVDLRGRHVLVTGASSGIGQDCAILCASLGATVSLFGRNQERLEATRMAMDQPDRHRCYPVDLSDGEKTQQAVEEAMRHAGKFGGFIHSAGVQHSKPLKVISRNDIEELFAVNVTAAIDLLRLVCSKKRRAEGLSCVLIASVRAHAGEAGIITYSASKGALLSGARAAAAELARYGIRVNTVSPRVHSIPDGKRVFQRASRRGNRATRKIPSAWAGQTTGRCQSLRLPAFRRRPLDYRFRLPNRRRIPAGAIEWSRAL